MESDPVVSSTVTESDLLTEFPLGNGVCSEPAPFSIDTLKLDALTVDQLPSNVPIGDYNNLEQVDLEHLKTFRSDAYFPDLEIPEMEFDEDGLELACEKESSPEVNAYVTGRMTPDGLIDDDFEQELGLASKELSVQDVIDSDFPDISRLGVLQVAGEDRAGRKVIVFSACRLPAVGLIDHQRLLSYIIKTLEQYVVNDYSLVYFHYGLTNQNKPRLGWLIQAYRTFDRNFRKNLKALYIVHPTLGIKLLWSLFRPFISSKMTQKVIYVDSLKTLEEHIVLDQLPIPRRVLEHNKVIVSLTSSAMSSTSRPSVLPINSTALTFSHDLASVISGGHEDQYDQFPPDPQRQFNVSLQFIRMNNGGRSIPVVVEDVVEYLRERGLDTEWIFRRSASLSMLRDLQSMYNSGASVDLREYDDPHLAASLIKSFFRELSEPVFTFELYDEILSLSNVHGRSKIGAIKDLMLYRLPDDNYEVLNYFFRFLTEVTLHAAQNNMNATNLSVVLGPSLVWSRQNISVGAINLINSFVQLLITHYESIFIK